MTTSYVNVIVLPSLPQKLLVGLDTLALAATPRFLCLKEIPSGWHFLFGGADAQLSVRTGYWIHVPDAATATKPWLRVFKWNETDEVLEPSASADELEYWRTRVLDEDDGELSRGLLPYNVESLAAAHASAAGAQATTPDLVDIAPLTSHITASLLGHVTRAPFTTRDAAYMFSTAACSPEDRDDIPGISDTERKFSSASVGAVMGEERELCFLGIDLKRTWRDGAVGRERTVDAQDRSGALERVVEASAALADDSSRSTSPARVWGSAVLGEMQLTFLMVLLLANWSCLEEWKRIIALVLTCRRAVVEQTQFFAEFIETLLLQLQRCDDVDGGLFDISGDGASFLKKHLRDFRKTLQDLDSSGAVDAKVALKNLEPDLKQLEDWLSQEWDWTLNGENVLRKGMLQLEDGERLEVQLDGLEADDETGEYAPVIVDLD